MSVDGDEALNRVAAAETPAIRDGCRLSGRPRFRQIPQRLDVRRTRRIDVEPWQSSGAIELDRLSAAFSDTSGVFVRRVSVEALTWPVVICIAREVANQIREMAKGSAIALAIHYGRKHW